MDFRNPFSIRKILSKAFNSHMIGHIVIKNFFRFTCDERKLSFFFPFFLLHEFYIVFYSSYVSIYKDLQKTIVLSSGPFLQVFTFTIQYICNLWWSESCPSEAMPKTRSKSTGEHLTQKHDSNKAAAMHLCWNHTTAWVPPPPVESSHMP